MKPIKKLLGGLFSLVVLLLAVSVFIVLAVMAEKPAADKQGAAFTVRDEEPLANVLATDSDDIAALARLFDDSLPALKNHAVKGEIRNAVVEGKTARVATLYYEDLTIAAVRPASAAEILLRDQLSVVPRNDLVVLSMPALYAARGNEHCLYFSSDTAAYSIYAPNLSQEDFFTLAALVQAVR